MLGAGLAASFTVRPFDSRVSTSRFNAELWEDTRLDRTFESGELVGGRSCRWVAPSPPTGSDVSLTTPR